MKKTIAIGLTVLTAFFSLAGPLQARSDPRYENDNEKMRINQATAEAFATINTTGSLIEIGNTTAAETTIVLRVTDSKGTKDITVEINEKTNIQAETGRSSNLSDWIAGDQIALTAQVFTNSDSWVAKRLRNLSFHSRNRGLNGWVTAIRPEQNQMDIKWQDKTYTLNTAGAKLVVGTKNPAQLSDFKVDDRIRARVIEDNDGNSATWKAETVVTLRRGKDLFMRVTRWVVPATIVSLPATSTLPTTIVVKILPSKFYQEGDVNNIIGQPRANLTVDVSDKTKLVRKYLGKATLDEFTEGDEVRIVGRWDDTSKHLVAEVIKDNSLQKLDFMQQQGSIKSVSVNNNSLQIGLLDGSTWTVLIVNDTHITKYRDTLKLEQLQIGDVIRIRGVANSDTKTITASAIGVITLNNGEKIKQPHLEP